MGPTFSPWHPPLSPQILNFVVKNWALGFPDWEVCGASAQAA